MSIEISAGESHVSRFARTKRRLLRMGAVGASSSLAFTGAVAVDGAPAQETHATAITAPAAPIEIPSDMDHPCLATDDERTRAAAQACLEEKDDTKVAVVAFAGEQSLVQEAAEELEQSIAQATDGDFTPDVIALAPSSEAQAAHDAIDDTCLSSDGPNMPDIAREHMPELDDYDLVVASTAIPSCDENVGGRINFDDDNIVIYSWKGPKKQRLVHSTAHEIIHDKGAGHAGHSSKNFLSFGTNNDGTPPVFDYRDLARTLEYREYGDGTIMGQGTPGNYGALLPPAMLDGMSWPERVLEMEPTLPDINQRELYLENTTDASGGVALLRLDNPISVSHIDAKEKTMAADPNGRQRFDMLAIEYLTPQMREGVEYPEARLSLVSRGALTSSVHIGVFYDNHRDQHDSRSAFVHIGDQSIFITFGDDGIFIRDIAPAPIASIVDSAQ